MLKLLTKGVETKIETRPNSTLPIQIGQSHQKTKLGDEGLHSNVHEKQKC